MADEQANGANGADEFEEDRLPNYRMDVIKGAIRDAFEEIYAEEREIAALEELHLKPHKQSRTKLWRNLKADTTVPRADLKHLYGLYKRVRDAEDSDDLDADVVRDNIRAGWAALSEGDTLDFITVLADVDAKEPAGAPA